MNRQEEADEIIKSIQKMTTVSGTDLAIKANAKDYTKKYYPKDELFEKWKEFSIWSMKDCPPGTDVTDAFNKAKELGLFTMALDEFWEKLQNTPVMPSYNYKEIRNKYTKD